MNENVSQGVILAKAKNLRVLDILSAGVGRVFRCSVISGLRAFYNRLMCYNVKVRSTDDIRRLVMAVSVFPRKIRYLVDEHGHPTDVLVDYETWQAVMEAMELLEDWSIAQAYLERRKSAENPADLGLTRLPDSLAEDDVDAGLD